MQLVEAAELVPLIDSRRFSLASVESAYNALRDRDEQGKIIVDLADAAHGEKFLDPRRDLARRVTQPRVRPPSERSDWYRRTSC